MLLRAAGISARYAIGYAGTSGARLERHASSWRGTTR